jgi:hypothetical protein
MIIKDVLQKKELKVHLKQPDLLKNPHYQVNKTRFRLMKLKDYKVLT